MNYNGWLFRRARHFWCGMIHGHEWENLVPELYGVAYVYQRCTKCGKGRVL